MAMMLKVCALREGNPGGDTRYRYLVGRIDEQTRVVVMPDREKPDSGDWVLYIAPDANPPSSEAMAESPEE